MKRRFPRYTAMAWKSLLVLPVFTVVALTALAGPSYNSARIMDTPIGPLSVYGYVYDMGGQPLEGATVVVTILESGATATDTTGPDGSYVADPDIPADKYDLGYTIQVVATYNSNQQSTSVLVDQDMHDFGVAQVDVHYTYEIPEFGSIVGLAFAMVAVCVVALLVIGRRVVR